MRNLEFETRAFAGVAVFALLIASAAASDQAQTTPASANAQQGKELYLKYSCYACHGYDGHGGAGARLVPLAMTVPRFTAYVHNPRRMPPYTEKVLSDAQLADLFAYIKSLPVSPPADQIPLLSRIMSGK
jgi:ubiquinol-cytochrome c reductase cytochrome c subunit